MNRAWFEAGQEAVYVQSDWIDGAGTRIEAVSRDTTLLYHHRDEPVGRTLCLLPDRPVGFLRLGGHPWQEPTLAQFTGNSGASEGYAGALYGREASSSGIPDVNG